MQAMSSLIRDIRDAFKSKGLEYVSIAESPGTPRRRSSPTKTPLARL